MKKIVLLFCLLAYVSFAGAKTQWKALWINTEHCQSEPNTWLAYRKTVEINKVPQTLIANIAADSKYWLWVNGELVVFEGGLKRGPAPDATYYDSVDIAPFLVEGENTIAVLVWHFGKNGFSHRSSGMAGLLFEAIGEGVEILSDKSWMCQVYNAYQTAGAPYPNYRLSESNIRFDARLEIEGWNMPDFSGTLSKALIIDAAGKAPFGRLIERPIPLWKDHGLTAYEEVRESANGDTLFCRLPYNCHVTPYLKVEAPAGKTIKIQDDIYKIGKAYNLRAEYITKEGVQEYESYGWLNGHEIWYIIPQGVKVLDLKYRETGYNTEFTGAFECNDDFLNEVWKRSARTLYITMRDSYMDCPNRERAQWWGDQANELGEAFYALSPSSQQLAFKGIYELMNWQRADGVIFSPIPQGNYTKELPLQMLASVGWYGFYTQYYFSGNDSFVADIYDRMHRYLHEVWQLGEDGMTVFREGEWSWGDWGENIDIDILTDCWYYLALKGEREFARLLGKDEDVAQITSMMESIANGFDNKYWNGQAYRSAAYTGETDDRAQAMAVVAGLASEDKYPALLKVLRNEYHASPYMEKYVLEAIFLMDDPDFAMERIKLRYDNMITNYPQYTTLFEGWETETKGVFWTNNHAWSGGPLTLLSQKVCGIAPTAPGFATFAVCPQMGSLKTAKATVDTKYGKIQVSLTNKGSKINLTLVVPEGTKAEVPVSKGKTEILDAGTHSLTIKP